MKPPGFTAAAALQRSRPVYVPPASRAARLRGDIRALTGEIGGQQLVAPSYSMNLSPTVLRLIETGLTYKRSVYPWLCRDPLSWCPDYGCSDTQTDPSNCGQCGHACVPGDSCHNGHCLCPDGGTRCGAHCCSTGFKCLTCSPNGTLYCVPQSEGSCCDYNYPVGDPTYCPYGTQCCTTNGCC